jgi:hypothetical protein
VPHVGIERLRAGHSEDDGTEREESEPAVEQEELEGVPWVERRQDFGVFRDVHDPEHGKHQEIEHHDRAEQRADLGGAPRLDEEQEDEDEHRDRQHKRFERVVHHHETLNRRKHRDRRGDHAVAIEQRGREYAQHHDHHAKPRVSRTARNQREQRKAAALPLVVRAHDDGDVLDRHHQHHRPEDEADDTVDVNRIKRERVMPRERLAKRVKRRCADVAEHDADRGDRELRDTVMAV